MIGIHYVHEVGLPSRFAAPVQILNTCRALAELGHEVTVYLSALGGDPATLLSVSKPTERSSRARMSGLQRREQLLDVTKRLAVRRGFHEISIEVVAREAGIIRPVVCGHFEDLDGLLDALRAISEGARTRPGALDPGAPVPGPLISPSCPPSSTKARSASASSAKGSVTSPASGGCWRRRSTSPA